MIEVLVVDDDQAIVRLLEYGLGKRGYIVRAARNGREGLQQMEERMPDLVILDIMMPEMDGWETCQHIRRESNVPIIMLTSMDDKDDIVQGLRLGADEYITKPFSVKELLARMEAVLRRTESGRQQGLAEAEAQMKQLREAISRNISHELRTPLAIISPSLQLVLEDRFGDDAEERRRFIQQSLDNVQRLHRLVEDLIALSALDQGEVEVVRQVVNLKFDFHEPVEQCLQRWQKRYLNVHIAVEPGVTIYAPRNGFKQAAVHLIDNACKFSPDGGLVEIELAVNGVGGCILTVTDQGPDIPVDLRERVFERYFQGSGGDARQYEGLGVGLTIARTFAQRLGGDVAILDSDTGCRVQMTIPPGLAELDT